MVSRGEEERRKKGEKYFEKKNIWYGGETELRRRRREIFGEGKRFTNFPLFLGGGMGLMGVGSRGRFLYHLYKNVNLVEICCEIASDVLSAYDVFPFLQ